MGIQHRAVSSLAFATGIVAVISVMSLALFFAVGAPFGAINDWTVGLVGLLSGLLAVAIRNSAMQASARSNVWTGVAVVGGLIVVAGSALVLSLTTGFLLAGLVESLGFGLIGLWLIDLNRSFGVAPGSPGGLRILGLAAGMVMALGIVVAPGIVLRLDDADTAPAWIWLGFVGWLGIFLLYPLWSIWLGRTARREAAAGTAPKGVAAWHSWTRSSSGGDDIRRRWAKTLTLLGLAFALVAAIVGCQSLTGVVPDGEMELHANNGTPLQLVVVVNGHTDQLPPNAQVDLSAPNLPSLSWMAEVRTLAGRTLLSLTVRSGDIIEAANGRKGDAARVDLSCGRIDLWSGPPLLGPAPGPGTSGDCVPWSSDHID
jgi:hypothetical protein